jgi:hypothetical protein
LSQQRAPGTERSYAEFRHALPSAGKDSEAKVAEARSSGLLGISFALVFPLRWKVERDMFQNRIVMFFKPGALF